MMFTYYFNVHRTQADLILCYKIEASDDREAWRMLWFNIPDWDEVFMIFISDKF